MRFHTACEWCPSQGHILPLTKLQFTLTLHSHSRTYTFTQRKKLKLSVMPTYNFHYVMICLCKDITQNKKYEKVFYYLSHEILKYTRSIIRHYVWSLTTLLTFIFNHIYIQTWSLNTLFFPYIFFFWRQI